MGVAQTLLYLTYGRGIKRLFILARGYERTFIKERLFQSIIGKTWKLVPL